MKTTKYILAVLLLLIICIFVVAYFNAVDSHDAILWSSMVMAVSGLVAGALIERSK